MLPGNLLMTSRSASQILTLQLGLGVKARLKEGVLICIISETIRFGWRVRFRRQDLEIFKSVEFRGNLCLNQFDSTRHHVMDMWILKDYNKFSWVKEYSIDLSNILSNEIGLPSTLSTYVMGVRDEPLLIRHGRSRD
ncbi:hypothetical protein COLO4_34142 [Corchorus olitorius]|uniref:F-box associated domain-containing protein n=1 Tax=Corchorus olitorius TaxID=93759 RepID=A0A1R3GNE5_9ROSI|nr:hypothetical protein COLO4_34142 [Corchorus olitorius]